jgi:hypothetical protein
VIGTKCPLCDYVHPNEALLNDLIEHIQHCHTIRVRGVTLGDPTTLDTDRGTLKLQKAEKF